MSYKVSRQKRTAGSKIHSACGRINSRICNRREPPNSSELSALETRHLTPQLMDCGISLPEEIRFTIRLEQILRRALVLCGIRPATEQPQFVRASVSFMMRLWAR